MPVYEHACNEHGTFTDVRPFDESGHAAHCPVCMRMCDRIVSLPHKRAMSRQLFKAMEINERSRHEPHVCSHGCKHHDQNEDSDAAFLKKKAEAQSARVYDGPRPWVIEHV